MIRNEPSNLSTSLSTPYPDVDSGPDTGTLSSTAIDGSDPLAPDDGFEADTSETEGHVIKIQDVRSAAKKRHTAKRSTSDIAMKVRARDETSHAKHANSAARSEKGRQSKRAKPQQHHHVSPHAHRPAIPRASSSSQVELLSRYHDPSFPAANLQRGLRELVVRTEDIEPHSFQPHRAEATQSTNAQTFDSNVEGSVPTFRWYARARSSTGSTISGHLTQPKHHSPDTPLKPCLKVKAKSTTASPPGELYRSAETYAAERTLRRMKTVDFEEATKPLLALPTVPKPSKKPVHKPIRHARASPTGGLKATKSAPGAPSCPTLLGTAKSNLAQPATTHTDVHVIAIAPSRNVNAAVVDKPNNDPATPTMQYVESNNGCYEVIWDDVPVDQGGRERRRNSSASHSLQQIGPSATRGLQRVNSKLADWSGGWNAPSESFKPTIVVFPDDDARAAQFECAVEDEEDLLASAPPNSHTTSAIPSRVPSRPASAPLTRAPSEDEAPLVDASQEDSPEVKEGWVVPLEDALLVPDPEMQSTHILNASRRMRHIPVVRKLSNVDDAELKFRGHRDSVTLARTRLLYHGGVSPELFAHRDSVSMARKRMHARNHATSAARNIPVPKSNNYTSPLAMSLDDTVLDMPMVKQHAAAALRSQRSASVLAPQQEESKRHIRIVE